jgi:hypothetical protein
MMSSGFFSTIGTVGAALLGTWLISRQLSFEKVQKLREYVTSFNDRYDKIVARIPLTVLLDNDDKPLKEYGSSALEIERAIYDYFALSEEELDLISERSKQRGFWGERGQAAKVWKTAKDDWVAGMRSNCELVLFVECKNKFETGYESGARGIDQGGQFNRLNRLLKGEDYLD